VGCLHNVEHLPLCQQQCESVQSSCFLKSAFVSKRQTIELTIMGMELACSSSNVLSEVITLSLDVIYE
jgi:hypothetical protein